MAPDSFRLESVAVVLIDLAEGPVASVESMPRVELRANAGRLAELCKLLEIPDAIRRSRDDRYQQIRQTPIATA
jgi:hypothetical protein